MKRSKFTESQIIKAIKEIEGGRLVEDVARELSVSKGTIYTWRKKYSGMEVSHLKRLKELEEEYRKLKQMYADLSLDHEILKDIVERKL